MVWLASFLFNMLASLKGSQFFIFICDAPAGIIVKSINGGASFATVECMALSDSALGYHNHGSVFV